MIQALPRARQFHTSSREPPRAYVTLGVGLAESGQRREEGPLSGRIRVGLDSYVDHDKLTMGASARGFKAMRRLGRQYCSRENILLVSARVRIQLPRASLAVFGDSPGNLAKRAFGESFRAQVYQKNALFRPNGGFWRFLSVGLSVVDLRVAASRQSTLKLGAGASNVLMDLLRCK